MANSFSFDEFIGGIPMKMEDATKDTLDGKAYRIGYQSAKLEGDRQALEKEKAQFEQEKMMAFQQLLSAQAQQASMMGAASGATAGLSAGLGMSGIPTDPGMAMGGGQPMPPMPPMPPQM